MKSENNFSLEKLDVSNLPELQGWKDKQETLVKENPFVEITDNKTYEVAKASRTALLKGRTSLENQEKTIASKLASFRKDVGAKTQELIDITLPHENKQQEEVKRFEQIKENERLERERIEKERIDRINANITDFETDSYKVIQSTTFETIDENKSKLESFATTEFDFEEFDILFEQAKDRVKLQWDSKVSELQEKEIQRLENERLKAEKEESYRKLKEIQDKADAEKKESDAKLKAIQDQQEAERKEREEKEFEQKEQMFEIRKKRLEDVEMVFTDAHYDDSFYTPLDSDYIILATDIKNMGAVEFEETISECKKVISEAKDRIKKESDAKLAEEAKAKADADKLAKENAKRVKRLADEKSLLSDYVSTLEFYNSVPNLEQKETSEFLDVILKEVADLKTRIINQINEL